MILVRKASESDLGALAEILRRSPEAGRWDPGEIEQSVHGEGRRECWVAERDGQAAGLLLAVRPLEEEAEILTLAVDPEARRRGLASAILTRFLERSRGRVFLEVRPSNAAARRLYAALGFTPAGLRRGYYQSPPEDALVLEFVAGR